MGRGRDSRAFDNGVGLDINAEVYGLNGLNTIEDLAGETDRGGENFLEVEGPCGLPLKMEMKIKGLDKFKKRCQRQ